ncbi:MAG: hypothetical protein IK093_16560 [Ruminiclostridium sp.]|nr:hypothetical protein [Ruminiclostridium sp.]
MNKKEIMKMLYEAIADKKMIEPSILWDCVGKDANGEEWDKIVALTNELAVNAFTAGFNTAMEIMRG